MAQLSVPQGSLVVQFFKVVHYFANTFSLWLTCELTVNAFTKLLFGFESTLVLSQPLKQKNLRIVDLDMRSVLGPVEPHLQRLCRMECEFR